MKRISHYCHNVLLILAIIILFSGLFMIVPIQAYAFPDLSTDGTCIECHPDGRHGNGEPAELADPSEPIRKPDPPEPTEPAEPSEPTEPAKPTEPAQPSEPEGPADDGGANPLLIAGLVIAAFAIAGAGLLLKKNEKNQ